LCRPQSWKRWSIFFSIYSDKTFLAPILFLLWCTQMKWWNFCLYLILEFKSIGIRKIFYRLISVVRIMINFNILSNIINHFILNLCWLTVSYSIHLLILLLEYRLDQIIFNDLILKWLLNCMLFWIFLAIYARFIALMSIQYWPIIFTATLSFIMFYLF